MHLTVNPFALILALSGLVTILMALIIFRRLQSVERSFAVVIGLVGYWALTYSAELFSTTFDDMVFWLKLEYIGITGLGPALLYFIRVFTGKQQRDFKSFDALMLAIPLLTIFFVWTNDQHHFYYQSIRLDTTGAFPLLAIQPSSWYYVFTVYFYATIVWSVYALSTAFERADPLYTKQKNTILYALLVPWVFNILYKVGISPNENIDLTPFAFIVTSFIISFGLLQYRLLDIIPAAREKIFESMQDGLMVLDAADKIIDKNLQMEQVLPIRGQKIIGTQFAALPVLPESLHEAVAGRKNIRVILVVDVDNDKKYYEVGVNVLYSRNAKYSGCVLIFHDISQQKKDAISLTAINKLKDRLFSIIAHDLRSPVINVMEMIRLIDEEEITEEEFKMFLPELLKNLNYTAGLLENLLHWSRSQLKGEMINAARVDIRRMIQHELTYYQQKANGKGIELVSEIKNEIQAFADAEMIQLVIRNLVGNAIKYCSADDQIIVSSFLDSSEEITICIADTGSGMKRETMEKLFLPENFSTRGTNNERGTGLGLLLCKDFIEKNNGKIWATTELGIGSKFYFTIPRAVPKRSAVSAGAVAQD